MNKPNIIHSFYSLKCYKEDLFIQSCYFILSCLYIKSIGGNISIHTDDKFASLMDGCPYDNVYVDLNDCYEAPRKFFAYAKLISLAKEPLGTIHIDGDVFLKKEEILDMLDFNDYDCITQHLELRENCISPIVWDESSNYFEKVEYPYYMNKFCSKMYNCGLLGFNNEKLFEEWYSNYFTMLEKFVCHSNCISDMGIPDIIIEQQSLTDLCDYKNYKVKTLLPSDVSKINNIANEIGYQHTVGHSKSEKIVMCLKKIQSMSQKNYDIIKNNWGKTYPLYFKYVEEF